MANVTIGTTYTSTSILGNGSGPFTLSNTVVDSGTNRAFAAIFAWQRVGSAETVSAMTLGGEAATAIVQVTNANSQQCGVAIGYWLDADMPSAGSVDLVVTVSGFIDNRAFGYINLSGVDATAVDDDDTTTEHDGGSGLIECDITTTVDNALVVQAVARRQNAITVAPADSQTEVDEATGANLTLGFGYREVASAGAITDGWTFSDSVRWLSAAAQVAFKPATAAAAGGSARGIIRLYSGASSEYATIRTGTDIVQRYGE